MYFHKVNCIEMKIQDYQSVNAVTWGRRRRKKRALNKYLGRGWMMMINNEKVSSPKATFRLGSEDVFY